MKRFLLWQYPRAVWQYDVMVVAILAFIFFTPREFFRDQARPASIVMVGSAQGEETYLLGPELLDVPEPERLARAAHLVKQKFGRARMITRVEPVYDAEEEVKAFMAYSAK